jgi:signal transduction histidine kinase/ligand-binding sensor domain-containing protein
MNNIYKSILTLILLIPTLSYSQKKPSFITGLPSKIINDLHVDRLGFIWIASDLGVYRFDGIDFTPFSHEKQASLSAVRLIEDGQGKMWFQNSVGQVFYIKDDETHFLDSYNGRKEPNLPDLALYKDSLVATSDHGLYLWNTKNFAGRYIKPSNTDKSEITSVAVVNRNLVAHGRNGWYNYSPEKGLRLLEFDLKKVKSEIFLESNTNGDTAVFYTKSDGFIGKIGIKNDSLVVINMSPSHGLLNSVSVMNNAIWVNTLKDSWQLGGNAKIQGQNIRDMVTDREGNIWYASPTNGLMVKYNHSAREEIVLPSNGTNDIVQTIFRHGNLLLLGTLQGKLHIYDPALKSYIKTNLALPANTGSVTGISAWKEGKLAISTSVNTYILDLNNYSVKEFSALKDLKQIDNSPDLLFATSPKGLYILPKKESASWKNKVRTSFKGLEEYHKDGDYFLYKERCNAICYHPEGNSIFIGLKSGLHIIDRTGIVPVKFKGKSIYPFSMVSYQGRIFIATSRFGLLIFENGKIRQHGMANGLLSETILQLKKNEDILWLVNSETTQLFDLQKLAVRSDKNFFVNDENNILDIDKVNDQVYMATSSGLYTLSYAKTWSAPQPQTLQLSLSVNSKPVDYPVQKVNTGEGDIQFKIGIPSYYKAKETRVRYALISERDTSRYIGKPGERSISFASLVPGKYTFMATAFSFSSGIIAKPVIYNFTVQDSLWDGNTLKFLLMTMLICFSIFMLATYYLNKRSFKKIITEQKQTIKNERQRISSEIHDDIGAGLFALKLYVDVSSKSGEGTDKMKQIGLMINDMSDVIKEIIWSTNFENDNLENLIYYIQFQSTKLFEHTDIVFESSIPEEIPVINVTSDNRKNVYLIVKEFIHNAIKHSRASHVFLNIFTTDQCLYLTIKDDGIGYQERDLKVKTMGLRNVRSRIEKVRGDLKMVSNDNGTNIFIEIPLG